MFPYKHLILSMYIYILFIKKTTLYLYVRVGSVKIPKHLKCIQIMQTSAQSCHFKRSRKNRIIIIYHVSEDKLVHVSWKLHLVNNGQNKMQTQVTITSIPHIRIFAVDLWWMKWNGMFVIKHGSPILRRSLRLNIFTRFIFNLFECQPGHFVWISQPERRLQQKTVKPLRKYIYKRRKEELLISRLFHLALFATPIKWKENARWIQPM